VIAHLADHGLKEIEVLRIDLSDLGQLEGQILDEKQQVTYLSHDLEEQESVLALNQRLKNDLLKKEKTQSLTQLENYRKLKTSETQIEHLISEFNARAELENVASTEKRIAKMMSEGAFSKARGRLPLPLAGGKVVSAFGKGFDALSGLQIFKKGVEISGEKSQSVLAVSAGRVAFSGELPNYGQVIIIDHGDHFYTLVGHLGAVLKQTKDWVSPGDSIGQMDQKGTPVYFEIRSRNVAVNPLQWVVN
jgi:septal ring factor EnvC (AmiA/AmiB activator)